MRRSAVIALFATLVLSTLLILGLRRANLSRLQGITDTLAFDLILSGLALIAFMASLLPWLALIILVIGLIRLTARVVGYILRRRQAA